MEKGIRPENRMELQGHLANLRVIARLDREELTAVISGLSSEEIENLRKAVDEERIASSLTNEKTGVESKEAGFAIGCFYDRGYIRRTESSNPALLSKGVEGTTELTLSSNFSMSRISIEELKKSGLFNGLTEVPGRYRTLVPAKIRWDKNTATMVNPGTVEFLGV